MAGRVIGGVKVRGNSCVLVSVLLALMLLRIETVHAQPQYPNLNFTGTSAWSASVTVPDTSSAVVFPDGVSRVPGNFVFKSGTNSVWNLNAGATVICVQDWTCVYNRFLIGTGDGMASSLTFTTGTLLNPGKLSAKGDAVSAIQIGEAATNSKGTLTIDGGVRIQTSAIYGEGPSPALRIPNGRLDVFCGDATKRLNGIAITLGPRGSLWVENHGANLTNTTDFAAFVSGATITAPGGTLIFQNSVEGCPLWGNAATGTLITVNSSLDSDGDGLPDSWEIAYGLDPFDNGSVNPRNGASGDPDADGSSNLSEYRNGTNPILADTDGDGLLDGVETNTGIFINASNTGSNPLAADTDMDGVVDGIEVSKGSDPNDIDDPGFDPDRDRDGLPDVWERLHRLNPNDDGSINIVNGPDGDPDNDGVTNAEEYVLGTDPQVNESGYAWQPRPNKAGLLVIDAHPDDEGIAFGGTLAYYTRVTLTPTVLLSMTSGDFNTAPPVREKQLRAAAWTYGLRNQPLFPRFRDYPTDIAGTWDLWADGVADGDDIAAGRLKASLYVAGIIRRYRPEVIVTHGPGGEYGHNDHIATCQAVLDAWTLAANPAIEIDGLPIWQPKKLYLHEWTSNCLFHDYWETPYPALGGKTPRAVTIDGLKFHYNQSNVSTVYEIGEVPAKADAHPSEWWGLYATKVGPDTVAPDFTIAGKTYSGWAKGDFLEHVVIPANATPLIICPSPINVAYPYALGMKTKVIDDSPTSSLTYAWQLVSGPGTVTFSPSLAAQNPTVRFSTWGQYVLRMTASDGNSSSTREVAVNVAPRIGGVVCAINCGGPGVTAANGLVWDADRGFSGGTPAAPTSLRIASTADEALFQSQRTGNCSYAIPLPNGDYCITLRFAETSQTQACLRRFHIDIEGNRVSTSLDPFVTAGFARAFDRTYGCTVADGMLNIQLTADVGTPSLAAILVNSVLASSSTTGGGIITLPKDPLPFPASVLIDPLADVDGDGINARDEFINGTSPTVADPPLLGIDAAARKLHFFSRVAGGAEYMDYTRHYRIEASTDCQPGSWTVIWDGVAADKWEEVLFPDDSLRKFFRLVTSLE